MSEFYSQTYATPAERHQAFANLPSSTQPDHLDRVTEFKATHRHPRYGHVLVIDASGSLSKITTDSGDEFWVKSDTLTALKNRAN